MTTASSVTARCLVDVDAALHANTAEVHDVVRETAVATPSTTHAALVGARNLIDASYISYQRHLSRRVTPPPYVNINDTYIHTCIHTYKFI